MANLNPDQSHLIPYKPGQSGNPNGRPKGRRSLSTIVRDVLEQELDWKLVPVDAADKLAVLYGGKAGWDVLVHVATSQALTGNVKAAEWLRKSGYGDKLDITSKGDRLQSVAVVDLGNIEKVNEEVDNGEQEPEIIEGDSEEPEDK